MPIIMHNYQINCLTSFFNNTLYLLQLAKTWSRRPFHAEIKVTYFCSENFAKTKFYRVEPIGLIGTPRCLGVPINQLVQVRITESIIYLDLLIHVYIHVLRACAQKSPPPCTDNLNNYTRQRNAVRAR